MPSGGCYMQSRATKLFSVPPDQIFEHPVGFPTDPKEIPEGSIPGWEAFAFDFEDAGVYGPFLPIVKKHPYGTPFIEAKEHGFRATSFWYSGGGEYDREGSCWYRSGCTLRFIKKREGEA